MRKIFSFVAAALFAGSMMAADLLSIDFTKGQGDWTINDVNKDTLSYVWKQDAQYGMKATAYANKAAHATESWLISPAINLTGVTASKLAFSQALNKGEVSSVSVKAKAGSGEWADLTVAPKPEGNSWTFIDSEADLAAYAGKADVQIAFVYTSTTTSAATWEIKTVAVNDGVAPAGADVTFLPSDFTGQGVNQTGGEVTATKEGVTFYCNKGYGDQSLKCYKNSKVSITSTTEQIGKLKFKFFSTYTGNLEEEIVVNAKEWTVESMAAQARFDKIEGFFGEYEKPVVPTVDTITVAQALEIGKALQVSDKNNKYPSEKSYVIKGYSCGIEQAYDTTYKNETFWISDTKGTRTIDKAVAFEVYRGKPNTQQEIGLDALVQFQCKILNFNGTIENYDSNMAVEVIEQGIVETVDTITVAAALEIAKKLTVSDKDNKYPSEKSYAIKGYVSGIQEYFSEQNKNETFFITDEKGARTTDKSVAFEVYRGKPNPAGEVGMDAYVLVTCKIINFNGTAENFESGPTVEVLEPGKPVVVDTISVAEALEIGNKLADNAYTDNPYVVIGYVTKAYEPDSGYTSQNFYMADDPDVRGDFYAYRAKPDSKIFAGDYVELFGKIQKYVGSKGTTIELSNGSVKHLEAPKVDTLTVAEVQALDLAEGATTVERFVVIGYVAAITADFEEDLQSFNLSDDATATTGEFACVDAIIAEPGANLHDQVKIVGKIQKMGGKFRMVSGKAAVLTPQGIENVVLTEKAQKVLVDGVIYIIRDNKIFNLQGTQVR